MMNANPDSEGPMRKYVRPAPQQKLDTASRQNLLADYVAHYASVARSNPAALNVKLPREAVASLLDELGGRLLDEADRLSHEPGPVRRLLDENRLPVSLEALLPDSFRAFCLLLNALKQWVAAEQAATDRYLLGGNARAQCRAAATTCAVTGAALGADAELHHPVRDGRPPILLSQEGHDRIEGQTKGAAPEAPGEKDEVMELVRSVKRNESWLQLRRGCLDHLGREPAFSTPGVRANARAFATRARTATGLGFEELIEWLDDNELG